LTTGDRTGQTEKTIYRAQTCEQITQHLKHPEFLELKVLKEEKEYRNMHFQSLFDRGLKANVLKKFLGFYVRIGEGKDTNSIAEFYAGFESAQEYVNFLNEKYKKEQGQSFWNKFY